MQHRDVGVVQGGAHALQHVREAAGVEEVPQLPPEHPKLVHEGVRVAALPLQALDQALGGDQVLRAGVAVQLVLDGVLDLLRRRPAAARSGSAACDRRGPAHRRKTPEDNYSWCSQEQHTRTKQSYEDGVCRHDTDKLCF